MRGKNRIIGTKCTAEIESESQPQIRHCEHALTCVPATIKLGKERNY